MPNPLNLMPIPSDVADLRGLVAKFAPRDGEHKTAIASLCLVRYSSASTPLLGVLSPALCIAAQGNKEVVLGNEVYSYGPGHHLVSSFELPTSARMLGATAAKPYLGLRLHFDPAKIAPLIEEARLAIPSASEPERGLYLAPTPPALLDAVLRLVRLLECPREIPILAPMIEREILFRLLLDESRAVLHRMAQAESPPQRVAVSIAWLRNNFRQPMRIDDLARRAGMSASGFHQWFRGITGMSPLQYQKQLRLQEARSMLRNERLDIASVSRRVGYESSSQFSREYSRLFGNPPSKALQNPA